MAEERKQKLYAYVDETGQDTLGQMFLVSVVVTGKTRDAARTALQDLERASGKRTRKWTRSRIRERVAYIQQRLARAPLLGPVYDSHYRNTRTYIDLLILSTAKALHARVMERPTATVFVDGLVYAERRRFAAGLRKLNVVVHKGRAGGMNRMRVSAWRMRWQALCEMPWRTTRRWACYLPARGGRGLSRRYKKKNPRLRGGA